MFPPQPHHPKSLAELRTLASRYRPPLPLLFSALRMLKQKSPSPSSQPPPAHVLLPALRALADEPYLRPCTRDERQRTLECCLRFVREAKAREEDAWAVGFAVESIIVLTRCGEQVDGEQKKQEDGDGAVGEMVVKVFYAFPKSPEIQLLCAAAVPNLLLTITLLTNPPSLTTLSATHLLLTQLPLLKTNPAAIHTLVRTILPSHLGARNENNPHALRAAGMIVAALVAVVVDKGTTRGGVGFDAGDARAVRDLLAPWVGAAEGDDDNSPAAAPLRLRVAARMLVSRLAASPAERDVVKRRT
ncbi:hypothetical protein HDU87_003082 [Geranomyces variabilis]|uniref:Uncharacterized protein n=1 Tax=Geranomyces variabilis TaxID=109894 RepID=A0AAD5TLB2_9FUNG|nr:hypothetical protein HDU87_003082 [Geranomyces variabilis]